jgi:hypothetical protein
MAQAMQTPSWEPDSGNHALIAFGWEGEEAEVQGALGGEPLRERLASCPLINLSFGHSSTGRLEPLPPLNW